MNKYLKLIILFLLFSCTGESTEEIENDFIAYIHNINEAKSSQNVVIQDSILQVVMHLFTTNSDRIIVIEGQSWNLRLKDRDGNRIAITGGYGRGPGEFELINHAYLSDDDVLHILDLRLMRITKYSFQGDEPELISVTNLPNYEMRIEKVYPLSEGNYVGIFRKNLRRTAGSFEKVVYKLDENFIKKEVMGSFFGGNMVFNGETYTEDELVAKSVWYFHNDQLYYARSDDFSIIRISDDEEINLIGLDSPLYSIPKFQNDEYIKNNLGDHFEYVFSILPDVKREFI